MMYDMNPSWDGQAYGVKRRVWFTGTTALRQGQGLAYDIENGTATAVDGDRGYKVITPVAGLSALSFAGVTDRAYSANALGQSVDIWLPGSICLVACLVDTTINVGIVNCLVSAGTRIGGLFYEKGFMGLGSAIPLQTLTGNVTGSSVDGSASVSGTTVSKTGLFTGAAVGDHVVIMASATTAGAAGATIGQYTIATVTSADAAELTASAGTGDIAAVVCDPSATVLCQLLDGPSNLSGMVNWVEPTDNAAAAPTHIIQGANLIFGGVTLGAGASTATLADGTFNGQRVTFNCMGTLTTNGYSLTVTSGEKLDGTTDITTLVFDAASEFAALEFLGTKWQLQAAGGGVTVT